MVKTWGRRTKHVLLVSHYVTSVGWLGVGLCQFVLNTVAFGTADTQLRHHAHEIAHVLDRGLLTFLAVGAAVSGVLLGWRSTWGVLRHWWVVSKLLLTVGLLIATPVWIGGWIGGAITATAGGGDDPPTLRAQLFGGSVTVIGTLLIMVVVSVVKPWGRTPRGRRHVAARRRATRPRGVPA